MCPVPSRFKRIRYHRQWTIEQKLKILREAKAALATGEWGAQQMVCHKYSITTQWLCQWKQALAKRGLWDLQHDKEIVHA